MVSVPVLRKRIRDAPWKASSRRKESLGQMTRDDWCVVVTREMQADVWYAQPAPDEIQTVMQIPSTNAVTASKNGNSPKVTVAVVNGAV